MSSMRIHVCKSLFNEFKNNFFFQLKTREQQQYLYLSDYPSYFFRLFYEKKLNFSLSFYYRLAIIIYSVYGFLHFENE